MTHDAFMRGRDERGQLAAVTIARLVVDVPDFPQPGVTFKDITPLLADGPAFRTTIDAIVAAQDSEAFDVVAGIEARGFVVAAAVAYATGVGVVPVRKAGKLPRKALSAAYQLEYGTATLEVHEDAFQPGARVLVVDDVLATGGTAQATLGLIEQSGASVVGLSVLIELSFLHGRDRLPGRAIHAVLTV